MCVLFLLLLICFNSCVSVFVFLCCRSPDTIKRNLKRKRSGTAAEERKRKSNILKRDAEVIWVFFVLFDVNVLIFKGVESVIFSSFFNVTTSAACRRVVLKLNTCVVIQSKRYNYLHFYLLCVIKHSEAITVQNCSRCHVAQRRQPTRPACKHN